MKTEEILQIAVLFTDASVTHAAENGQESQQIMLAAENATVEMAKEMRADGSLTESLSEEGTVYYKLSADESDAFYYLKLTNLAESGGLEYALSIILQYQVLPD